MLNILCTPVIAVRDNHGRRYNIYRIGTRFYAASADVVDELITLPSRPDGFFWCGRWYTMHGADCHNAAHRA